MTIGRRIAMLRHERGWSQTQLAEKAYAHSTAVSRWERDQRTPGFGCLLGLARAFGMAASELLEGVDR